MKLFHISDVLTATTGRLVSSRHMDGVYEIYNFLTGDSLFTHQLPRVARECQPWLNVQFPTLTEAALRSRLVDLDRLIEQAPREQVSAVVGQWVEFVRMALGLPEIIPVYEMGADMHTRIDPAEEARAMVGDDRLVVVDSESVEPKRRPDGGPEEPR